MRELKSYLEQQGLQIEPNSSPSKPNSGVASFKYGSPICGSQVRVSWEGDETGKVESLHAIFGDTGCP